MEIQGYSRHSVNQYSAHIACQDLLEACMERLASRMSIQKGESAHNLLQWADLGSSDGSNSLRTLRHASRFFFQAASIRGIIRPQIHVTFEDHPESDEKALRETLHEHKDWFQEHDMPPRTLMKSFYEPLFDADSIDFFMSYICLHWLDTADIDPMTWKSGGGDSSLPISDFVFFNESTTPQSVLDHGRVLAREHLARFVSLRVCELRPGCEALLVMVGSGNGFVTTGDGGPSPLTRALRSCIDEGLVRPEVLSSTFVPYYLRTCQDVKDAVKYAQDNLGAYVELVELKAISTITGGNAKTNDAVFALFWSIHLGAVKNAKPTNKELGHIQRATRKAFDDLYDPEHGIGSSFVACVIRRRSRKHWGTASSS